ncbi:MAG: family 43 glycosylhydrolase [Clostridiales bacterium]|nr:family 43 glycosylhydrolase [Clostridiales bacterium]
MQAVNPFLPSWEYVPDGEPRVYENRLYIYGSHDLFGGNDFCLGNYVCWSAPLDDLGNWRYEGVIYRKNQDPKNTNGKMNMCAPDVIQGTDGRYYLYYQLHALSITSVAVCDTPAGQYEFYGYVRHPDGTPWGAKRGDTFAFDPGVLKDDDGRYYLYVGFSPVQANFRLLLKLRGNNVKNAVCLELAEDMCTVKGGEKPVVPGKVGAQGTEFEGHAFFEASSPRKINGRYYFVYSSELSHELCYAVSDYPDRGYHYGGTLVSIGNLGYKGRTDADNYTGNTHGGMVEINGQWYIFYHRQTNLQKCSRQACAEKITILPDGSIPQVQTTSCGLNDGPLIDSGRYEARTACVLKSAEGTFAYESAREKNKDDLHPYFTQSGTDREDNPDQYIANLRDGSVAGFRWFAFDNLQKIMVSLRGTGKGSMDIRTEEGGEVVARIPVEAAEAYQSFCADLKVPVSGTRGLFFTFTGSGYVDFEWFELG